MIKVVINRCHGGFGLSDKAALHLIATNSELVSTRPIDEYFGTSIDEAISEVWNRHDATDLGDGLVSSYYGEIFNIDQGVLYQIGTGDQMTFRTHPDLLAVIELLGDDANSQYGKLVIVEIPDEDITLDKIEISEYDGAEWISEKHRTWS